MVGPCGDAEEGEGEEEEDGVEGREHLQEVAERRQHVQLLPRQNLQGNQMKFVECQSNETFYYTQVTVHAMYQNAELTLMRHRRSLNDTMNLGLSGLLTTSR